MREQKGHVWREGNWWLLRYRDSVVTNGTAVRKQLARKLAPVEPEHRRLKRPPDSVLKLAAEFLAPLNAETYEPTKNVALSDFGTNVWLPHIATRYAASTAHATRYYWERILVPRCGRALLRDFSTPAAQSMLDQIARQNPEMKKSTLHKLKSILSAVFKLAIQQGYRPGPNPLRETSLPRAQESSETVAYDLETVLTMLRLVPEPSRTVIAVAAFAGLRRGEIEGLTWEAYDGETLRVLRGMWHGIAGEPKSKKSKAAVPVVGPLRNFLDQHRMRCGNPEAGIMFPTQSKVPTPLSLNNLLNDYIRPTLDRCAECKKAKAAHGSETHEFTRDASRPEWHGWHAFRRGLATNLHTLQVDDLTIQKILRHSNVAITQACYIKTLPSQTMDAMKKLETLIDSSNDAMCSNRAVVQEGPETVQ